MTGGLRPEDSRLRFPLPGAFLPQDGRTPDRLSWRNSEPPSGSPEGLWRMTSLCGNVRSPVPASSPRRAFGPQMRSKSGQRRTLRPTWGSSENRMRQSVEGHGYRKVHGAAQTQGGFWVVVYEASGTKRKFSPPVFTSSSLSLPWEGENPTKVNS